MKIEIERINANTVNLVDYQLKSDSLAKVLVSFTGNMTAEQLTDKLCAKLQNAATPIRHSFKQVKPGLAVGFLRANRAVVAMPTRDKLSAKYRLMASNIYMDNDDKSLWEVKSGSTGKYLARHDQEDLSALVAATVQRRSDLPGLRHLTIAHAAKNELVAFVAEDGSMDYGFAMQGNDRQVKVMSYSRYTPMVVDYDNVVSMNAVKLSAAVDKEVRASLTPEEKKNEIEYWKKLYSWSGEYIDKLIEYVNQGTVM